MLSPYVIQVANRVDGKVAEWAPGLKVEQDLVNDIVDRCRAKGVGFLRTEAKVLAAVRDAIEESIYDLKAKI